MFALWEYGCHLLPYLLFPLLRVRNKLVVEEEEVGEREMGGACVQVVRIVARSSLLLCAVQNKDTAMKLCRR